MESLRSHSWLAYGRTPREIFKWKKQIISSLNPLERIGIVGKFTAIDVRESGSILGGTALRSLGGSSGLLTRNFLGGIYKKKVCP